MATKRVLIVNNASDRGKGLAFALGSLAADLQVGILPSAEEAFLSVMQSNVDLVVVDLHQPGKDSLDLVNIIHARIPSTRIILIVDPADAQLKDQAASAGVTAFFNRPADKNEFLKAAAYCLGMPPVTAPLSSPKSTSSDATLRALGERLAALIKCLGATGSGIYDKHGKRLTQAGMPPDELVDAKALPGLLSAVAAAQKAGQQLGQTSAELVLTMKSPEYHLLAAPLSGVGAVLVCLRAERTSLRLAIALEELFQARQELEQILHPGSASSSVPPLSVQAQPQVAVSVKESQPTPVGPISVSEPSIRAGHPVSVSLLEPIPAEIPAENDEAVLSQQLATLLQSAGDKKLQAADVDAFWNEVATTKPESSPTADLLSYEQARNMGLTPKESGR